MRVLIGAYGRIHGRRVISFRQSFREMPLTAFEEDALCRT